MNTGRTTYFLKGLFVIVSFCLIFFFFARSGKAYNFQQTFDSYNNGVDLNTVQNFSTSVGSTVETTDCDEGKCAVSNCSAETINFLATSSAYAFDLNDKNNLYNGGSIFFKNNGTVKFTLLYNYSYPVQEIKTASGQHIASTTNDVFQNLEIRNIDERLFLYVDGSLKYSTTTDVSTFSGFSIDRSSSNCNGKTLIDNVDYGEDIVEYEIIDLPDPGEVYVQTGYDDFYFEEYVTCMTGDNDCVIRFVYSYDDIGSMVLLIPETATSVMDYVDLIENLADQSALEDTLSPTVRYASTTDQYRIFVIPDTGSSTLYEMVNVEWIEELSEENFGLFNSLISKFKNIFPLSILLQIKEHVNSLSREDVAKISITFNDLIPAEWSGVTNTDPLLAEDLLTDNLPIWNTHIYPFLKTIIWFMTWLYIIFRIKSLFASDNPDD